MVNCRKSEKPAASVPRSHCTVLPVKIPPPVAETNVVPVGTVAVIVVELLAVLALPYVIVYVSNPPGGTRFGVPTIARFIKCAPMVTPADAVTAFVATVALREADRTVPSVGGGFVTELSMTAVN